MSTVLRTFAQALYYTELKAQFNFFLVNAVIEKQFILAFDLCLDLPPLVLYSDRGLYRRKQASCTIGSAR